MGLIKRGQACNEKSLSPIGDIVTSSTVCTVYRAKTSSFPEFYLDNVDNSQFVDLLKGMNARVASKKEDNCYMSPAAFDPFKSDKGYRKEPNIVHLRHVYLDFENGVLNPDEFAKLFPGLQMVITNTFNHTGSKPRFRVIILTATTMTPEVYKHIYDQIALKLEEAGYSIKGKSVGRLKKTGKPSGLDWSKRAPVSMFLAPCQAHDPSQTFFTGHLEGRTVLDPIRWIQNGVIRLPPRPRSQVHTKPRDAVDQILMERAATEWRASSGFPGEGNARFFTYARTLQKAGMSMHDIEDRLISEATYGRSPDKRKAQVKSIIASLSRSDGRGDLDGAAA